MGEIPNIFVYRQFVYINGHENKIRMLQRELGE